MAAATNPLGLATTLAGTGVSLIMGLLATHDKRVQAAKQENAAVAQAIAALDSDLKTIFDALNSGDISEQVAVAALTDVHLWYWAFIQPLQQGATKGPQNTFPATKMSATQPFVACYGYAYNATCECSGTACTAGCCIGCGAIDPSLSAAIHVVNLHGGTFQVCVIVENKYGLAQRAAYNITYTKPKVTNTEAEVTINQKTGIVTVGANPTSSDAVIATGVVSTSGTSDAGGDQIQHNASGTDINVTQATPAPGSLASIFAQIPGGMTTVYIVGVFLLLLIFLPTRSRQQPQIIEVTPNA